VTQIKDGDGNWDSSSYVADLGDVIMTLKSEDTQEEEDPTEEE
jgi:hypothetical protein